MKTENEVRNIGIVGLLVLSILLSIGNSAIGQATADSYEPDNKYTVASPIISGYTQTHSIHNSGTDVEWVTFTLSKTSDVVIVTSGHSGDTIILFVFFVWCALFIYHLR